jgi:molybdopterin/thiamine biosynthesis adenylyltransferase
MQTRIVILEEQLTTLSELLFDQPGVEGAAFLLCGESRDQEHAKLVVHAIQPIQDDEYLLREPYRLSISSKALTRIAKLARYEKLSIIFAHSHPDGVSDFSTQDDKEEEKLIPFFQSRVPERIHGTIVLTKDSIAGRLYCPTQVSVDSIVSIGNRTKVWSGGGGRKTFPWHDRQVRAFGSDIQATLQALHIGVIGVGGTGSAVAEQLYRLGVGSLTLIDGDQLELTNLNRVYGSRKDHEGKNKAGIAKSHLDSIGLGTEVHAVQHHITEQHAAKLMRRCDIVFGCTDKQIPRAILNQLSIRYTIPLIDVGVLVDSEAGQIGNVLGRVTTFFAGESCLFCRGRISPEQIRIESLSDEDRAAQAREGYAPELDEPAPAVIPFTTAIASAALSELIHRLTGFMGSDRQSTEVLYFFDENRIRTNRVKPREMCTCVDSSNWGRGDTSPFLDLFWTS